MGSGTPAIAQGTKDPCRDEQGNEICPHYNSFDSRVNYLDPLATITAFCTPARGLDVWIIVNSQGQYVYTASNGQLSDGLGSALVSGQRVLIADQLAMQVWGLPSNQLMLRDGRNGYEFAFSPALCGVTANMNAAIAATSAVTVPTVSAPSGGASFAPTSVPIATPGPRVVIAPYGSQPKQTAAGEFWGTVRTTSNLNLRTMPSTTLGTLIVSVPSGTALNVIGRSPDSRWLYVEYAGLTGWVYGSFTTIAPEALPTLKIVVATVG
jgi:hypothetical protein